MPEEVEGFTLYLPIQKVTYSDSQRVMRERYKWGTKREVFYIVVSIPTNLIVNFSLLVK